MSDDLPPLKTDPKYGWFPWWPEDGDAWVHPEDASTARSLIPSPRIWRRDGETGRELVVMHYGEVRLRVRRVMWREIPGPLHELGDWVEVRPLGMTNEPHTGQIRERRWDTHAGAVRYWLALADGTQLERGYGPQDLKPIESLTGLAGRFQLSPSSNELPLRVSRRSDGSVAE